MLLVGLSVAFIRLLSPYLVAIAVAVILALLLRHPLNWLLGKNVARGAATALVVVALMVLGAVFLILFGILLTSELEEGVRTIRSEWPKLLAWAQQRLPWMQALVEQYELEQRISDLLGNAASQILSLSQAALSSVAAGILRAVVVAFLVIYLLLEGEDLVDRLYQLLPLDRTQTDQLMRRAAQTLDATVLGTLFIGVLEGTFGGLLFVLFGLPSATLWGLIMVLVSVLPLLGHQRGDRARGGSGDHHGRRGPRRRIDRGGRDRGRGQPEPPASQAGRRSLGAASGAGAGCYPRGTILAGTGRLRDRADAGDPGHDRVGAVRQSPRGRRGLDVTPLVGSGRATPPARTARPCGSDGRRSRSRRHRNPGAGSPPGPSAPRSGCRCRPPRTPGPE